jgi:hypothetical protein
MPGGRSGCGVSGGVGGRVGAGLGFGIGWVLRAYGLAIRRTPLMLQSPSACVQRGLARSGRRAPHIGGAIAAHWQRN